MYPRNVFAPLCLLATTTAQAEIFRCTIDGRTTYRDRPCPPGELQATRPGSKSALEGCFALETSGWEGGRSTSLMRIANSAGHYTMTSLDDKGRDTAVLAMRRATPAELRDATRLLEFDAIDGLVLVVAAGTPNRPALPIGLYKGRDAYRDLRYFFYGYLSNGWAKPASCP